MTNDDKGRDASVDPASCDVLEMVERQNRELIVQQKQLLSTADQLEMANEKLKSANQMKSEFVSMVVHEIRNPLASVSQSIEVARDLGGASLPEKTRKYLEVAQRNVWRLNRILSDLLDLAKMEAGKLSIEVDAADPADLIEEAASFQQGDAELSRVSLIVEEAGLPPVLADANRIAQVLGNFISNAIKFTPQGGSITVSAKPRGEAILFSVADTGSGVAKEFQRSIFEKYSQLASWQGGGKRGTGLGLPICKNLITLHGSSIELESEQGKGARFSFALAPYTLAGRLRTVAPQFIQLSPQRAWHFAVGAGWKEALVSVKRSIGQGEWQVADPARGRLWLLSAFPEKTETLIESLVAAGKLPKPASQVTLDLPCNVAGLLNTLNKD